MEHVSSQVTMDGKLVADGVVRWRAAELVAIRAGVNGAGGTCAFNGGEAAMELAAMEVQLAAMELAAMELAD